jgi:hypothetical protein
VVKVSNDVARFLAAVGDARRLVDEQTVLV